MSLDISNLNSTNGSNSTTSDLDSAGNTTNVSAYSSTIAIQFGSETSKTSTTISTQPKRNIKDHYEFKDVLGTYVPSFFIQNVSK